MKMNKENLISKGIIVGSVMAAGILFLQGVSDIMAAGGFVSPFYEPDDGSGVVPVGPIPQDLLGDLKIMMAGFIIINGYITSKRYQMIKQYKNLEGIVDGQEKRLAELENREKKELAR
jgi:hypothetical protein